MMILRELGLMFMFEKFHEFFYSQENGVPVPLASPCPTTRDGEIRN